MRGLLLLVATVGLLLSCGTGFAKTSYLPENDLWREDEVFSFTGIDEETFNKVIDKMYAIYAPIVSNFGGTLVIERKWKSSIVNAAATKVGDRYIVMLYGGLARRSEITSLGFATVIAHEIGHFFGGFPLYDDNATWDAASEGQADYYATLVGLRKYFSDDSSSVSSLSKLATSKCKSAYRGQELRVCYHSLAGAQSCAALLSRLSGGKLDTESLDKSVVTKTNVEHPKGQCRWTTYIAGAVCKKPWDDKVIPTAGNQELYNCTEGDGARPRCWYAP